MNLPPEEMETIFNGIRDFIVIISPEKEVLEANDAFLKHMGYERKEVIGKKCYEVFKELERDDSNCKDKCPLEKVVREKRHCQVELTRLGKNGTKRYKEVSIFPVWEKKGKISKFIDISRDITERKIAEKQSKDTLVKIVEQRTQQLKDTHQRLLHHDKMASLGKLASSVVHEINNPVTGILNLVMLSQRILKEDRIKQDELEVFNQYLGLMETETRRIGRIVSNLLVFARQSKPEIIKFDVNELIEQLLILNSNLIKINKIRILQECEHNLPLIKGSEDHIKQVIMNLFSNAVESMSKTQKKRLTIKTRSIPDKKSVEIQVMDTGAGIEKDCISKIFEPFYTTKKNGKGVGLGLSVVYGIIKDQGGELLIDSTPGKGSCFTIVLQEEFTIEKKESGP